MAGETPVAPAQIVVYPTVLRPNPNIAYGQQDMFVTPSQYPRYATPDPHQIQLHNGVGQLNFGRRDTSPAASYLSGVAAFQPGQTRLSGTMPGDFAQKAMSPLTWQSYVASTAGMQPQQVGGVGTVNGPLINPGSGA